MAARRASLEPNPIKRAVLHSQAARLTAVESSVISRVALNLAVSGEDRDRLRAINPEAKVTVIDNGTDTEFFRPREDLAEENTIVFASSLRWYPNLSGLEFFDREIWPEIKRRCPGVRFIVAGQAPPPHLVRWAKQDAAIDFVPNPEDIRPQIARGAVYVCPIVDGGGSRLKLLDAMAMGKAIVSTEVGAEGLHYVEGHEMLVAKTPSLFAEYVIQLLGDSGRRKLMSIAARERSMAEYSWPVIGARLAQSYAVAVLARPTRQEHGPAIASAGHRL
jgi:glycosyltransferase involved in cell wall biosynthesis